MNHFNRLDDLKLKALSDSFSKKAGELNDTLLLANTILSRLSENTSANSKLVSNDMRSVNDQLNEVLNSINDYADSLEALLNGDVCNDLSYLGRENAAASRIAKCTNEGIVDGCKNAGGIAAGSVVCFLLIKKRKRKTKTT